MDDLATAQLCERLTQIYNEYRTVVLNKKYYGHKLKTAKRWNLGVESVIAVGTSSTISAWTFFGTPGGKPIWSVIGIAVALITVFKPIVPLSSNLERYSKLAAGYGGLCFDLKSIADEIRIARDLPPDILASFRQVQARLKELDVADDITPSRSLLSKYYIETNQQVPPESLWMPTRT